MLCTRLPDPVVAVGQHPGIARGLMDAAVPSPGCVVTGDPIEKPIDSRSGFLL